MIMSVLGSLGLFLLGMWLMTEGLKLAGGKALESLLRQWTSSRFKGLLSGTIMTALVQSSSAVTVATLGFVNAGLMNFQQAVWVVFGSNVGTTFTAWIVTFLGFSIKLNAFAFPLIGLGAFCRLLVPSERIKALGMALAGFGLLFMGIDSLNTNFSSIAAELDTGALLGNSNYPTLIALFIGLILTSVTQSSSAAIAIILTAVASGVATFDIAAAAVIGANIGTTSTALIACVGATSSAKRLAWAHVCFNLLTGVVALLLLPFFSWLTVAIAASFGVAENLVLMLAIFHTLFNVVGVLLMWPIEPPMSRFLMTRFKSSSLERDVSQHIDPNTSTIPEIAVRGLVLELNHIISQVYTFHIITDNGIEKFRYIDKQTQYVSKFINQTLKSNLTTEQGSQLATGMSITHNLTNAYRIYCDLNGKYRHLQRIEFHYLSYVNAWLKQVDAYLSLLATSPDKVALKKLVKQYKKSKYALLNEAIIQKHQLAEIDIALFVISLGRQFVEQVVHAQGHLNELSLMIDNKQPDGVGASQEVLSH